MTTRNLNALFAPGAIALVGASNEAGSVGNVLAQNLLAGGFDGLVMPVNPHEDEICSVPNFKTIADLPTSPDLAVIATPAPSAPPLLAELAARGCRAAVVVSAGFDGSRRDAMLAAAKPHLMRIVGPNCLGFLSPVRGINASFSHKAPLRGHLAFITQSGAIATSMIDWAIGRGIGFSHVLSLGDMADVDFGDLLDFLALDPDTSAILLYAETITQARKFMSAGRIAARTKPVIVVKGGRSAAGARAAASHTGALAGADAVHDAAFRRAGMLRVETLRELFDAAETLAGGVRVRGNRLTILTNGGGLGVLAADTLETRGGQLATLSDDLRGRLDSFLPASWSRGNPVDVLGDAHGDRYQAALEVLADQADSDGLLVMNCPTGVADSMDAARATARAKQERPPRPMIACWMGAASPAEARRLLAGAGIPNYETPDEAVSAFLHLAEYDRNQKALFETPAPALKRSPARREQARAVIEQVLTEGRDTLTEPEAKDVLSAYGIPVVATHVARSAVEAGGVARKIAGPVALKILSRQITHKSDVGGVHLNLHDAAAVEEAAIAMLNRVSTKRPDAQIDGFTIQQMVRWPAAQELLLGAVADPTFGLCLLFGHGGVATEVIADRCVGLPPLNANLALDMIGRTRVSKLLSGYRDRPPAKREAIAAALVMLSDLVIDLPEVVELDINPLLADAEGVVALDARIIVRRSRSDAPRLAIRPYPEDLVQILEIGPLKIQLRPIRPDDADRLTEMAQLTAPEDLRMRFHGAVGAIAGSRALRLSQIDYDREMVLVAELPDGRLGGVARLVFDPDFETAECAIIVRTDLQRRRLGRTLLAEAIAYSTGRGALRIWGDVLTANTATVDLARKLGGDVTMHPHDPRLVRATFHLNRR